jgi:hypothetical protein
MREKCPHGRETGKQCPLCFTVLRLSNGEGRLSFIDLTSFQTKISGVGRVLKADFFKKKT